MAEIPVVFVYLGNKLPEYAFHGLFLARERYAGDIVLLSDQSDTKVPDGVTFIDVSAWYQKDSFQAFSSQSPLDALFRGGFWLKTVERFFVLQQYMRQFAVEKLFHAELDVLILDLGGLAPSLDSEGKGVFIPSQRPGRAIASLVYISDTAALDKLVAFFCQNSHLGNEMNMLGAFLAEHPEHGVALPTEAILSPSAWPHTPRYAQASLGAIDAQWVGHHLFGYDPRNILGTSWNRFSEGPVPQDFVGTRFRYRQGVLTAEAPGGASTVIRAVHVHAKILRRLRSPLVLSFYCWAAELPFRIPIFVSTKGVRARVATALLSKASTRFFSILPVPVVKLFAPLGRLIVTSSPKILSERERHASMRFLQKKSLGAPVKSLSIPAVGLEDIFDVDALGRLPLDRLEGSHRRELENNMNVFLIALRSEVPLLFCLKDGLRVESRPREFFTQKMPLVVSGRKDYPGTKHARTYWGSLTLNTSWSFSAPCQLVFPEFVRMMFPGGSDDVLSWVQMGFNRPRPSLSAFQSYGLWLFSQERSRVVLVRAENVSE